MTADTTDPSPEALEKQIEKTLCWCADGDFIPNRHDPECPGNSDIRGVAKLVSRLIDAALAEERQRAEASEAELNAALGFQEHLKAKLADAERQRDSLYISVEGLEDDAERWRALREILKKQSLDLCRTLGDGAEIRDLWGKVFGSGPTLDDAMDAVINDEAMDKLRKMK